MYDSTSTFKTRRKHHLLLLTCLATLVHNVASMAVPISCPEPCECYLNNNGLQSARCSEINMNQPEFANIHVLVLRMSESQDQCDIPKDLNVIFPQLNYLYMMNCSLTNVSQHAFETLKYLQEIDLSNNFIETIESTMFVNNAKLTYANLQNNPLRSLENKPFLISKSITELDLSSCGIKKLPQMMFKSLNKLRFLTLYNNEISTIAENTLPEGLRLLNLGKNSISHVPIAEIERLPKLREIDLSENPINCTCSTLSFQDRLSGKPVIFLNNGMECMYPAEYRGRQSAHVPYMSICMAELAALKPDQDEDDKGLNTNEILPEEKPDKKKHQKGKKDNIQDDFERDEVVPYDKKSYIDEMQSDSISIEGSGGGSEGETGTDVPDVEDTKQSQKSDNKEDNETKQGNSSPVAASGTETSPTVDPPASEKTDVTVSKEELNNTNTETAANPAVSESEKPTDKTESSSAPPPPSSPETSNPGPETPSESSKSELETSSPTSESSKSELETTTPSSEPTKSEAETPVAPVEPSKANPDSNTETTPTPVPESSQSVPVTSSQAQNPSPSEETSPSASDASSASKSESPHSSTDSLVAKSPNADSGVSHALQKDDSNTMNLGYIIPCLAIIIVIIICLGIYLGQRSSHKNWEPAPTNDGAELQDVSLLPENGKMPIVKNKYPTETNSEQTERLMNDSNSSAPKSVWEHLEEPLENGNSRHSKDSDKLPNGQSIDKNEPIECAIAKVTTLPDSIPRTPLIRNT